MINRIWLALIICGAVFIPVAISPALLIKISCCLILATEIDRAGAK